MMLSTRNNQSNGATKKPIRRYQVSGVDKRCELLFHSMMRLASDKTDYKWLHDADNFDLIITDAEMGAFIDTQIVCRRLNDFMVASSNDCAHLRLASMVKQLMDVKRELARHTKPISAQGSQTKTPPSAVALKTPIKLTKWPSASFIRQHYSYPKLATLLISRPLYFQELVQRSGVDQAVCMHFVNTLMEHGLIDNHHSRPVTGNTPKRGLFTMIRERLGLGGHCPNGT